MIYEFRTYQIKAGSLQTVISKFQEKIEGRNTISKIGAFWYSEIGVLNQIVHVWPYENMEHRNQCREKAVKKNLWPPDTAEYMLRMNTEFWKPVSFSPKWEQRNIGPFFEMRIYTFPFNEINKMLPAWEEKIEARKSLAPEVGEVNKFMHIWGYKSLQHRTEAREKFSSIGWPPKSEAKPPLFMENKIVMPSEFSPIQ